MLSRSWLTGLRVPDFLRANRSLLGVALLIYEVVEECGERPILLAGLGEDELAF